MLFDLIVESNAIHRSPLKITYQPSGVCLLLNFPNVFSHHIFKTKHGCWWLAYFPLVMISQSLKHQILDHLLLAFQLRHSVVSSFGNG